MTSRPDRRFVIGAMVVVVAMMGVATVVTPAAAQGTDDATTERGPWWQQPDDSTFDSAEAEVVAENDNGEVTEVTFRYDAQYGKLVRLQAGDETEVRFGIGEERQSTVELTRLMWPDPEEYPIEVSAKIVGGEECTATITSADDVVTLCGEDEPQPALDVSLDTNSPVTEGETLTVDATVENTGDAAATEDATVSVADQSTEESVSLEPGESTTVGLEWQTGDGDAGTYTASASAGEASASADVTVEANETETDGTIEGSVTDNETGDAVEGATVSAGDAEATTDANGTYSLTVAEGDHTVSANADGYESASQEITVTAGETSTADFALDAVETDTNGTIEGTVTDNETGEAVEGATVSAGDAEATTDANGTYSLTVAEGDYTVSVDAEGYESASQDVSVTAGETTTADVALDAVETEGTIEGTVTDSETGDAIEGASVSADGAETTTDANGSYSLTVAEGDYTVEASAEGYQSASQDVTVTAGESTTADAALDPVETDGTVEGTVTDSETGDPIEGATVSTGDSQTTTAADGSYSLTLAEGDYTVSANAESYQSASQEVTVTAGETATADVALDPVVTEGTVEGTVTDADSGQGVGGATVSAGDAETTTADDGSYSLALSEGDYTVEASAEGYESATQNVTVTAGETTNADLDLAPEAAGPQEFTAYVRGTDAYLHTNVTSGSTNPIEFTECRDYEPTQNAIDNTPDNLPAPSCTTINGTYYPSNNTWTGDVDFPAVVQQRTHDVLGEILVEASITTDGASGTMNRETGEITMDASVDIGIQIYAPENGHDHEWSNRPDPITNAECRVPSLGIELSTEKSYESQSSFTGGGTVSGQRMGADGVSYLVTNDFAVDGATGCGQFGGIVPLNDSINNVLGIPTDVGQNEVAFDVETDFEE